MASSILIYTLLIMLGAYALGGIPFGLIFSKSEGTDVRTKGSGNIGTTNVTREVGVGAGIATLVCDVAKGFVATWFATWFLADAFFAGDTAQVAPTGPWGWCVAMVFMASILGHVFSPYLRFKGGKGIAVGFGAALGFAWPVALGLLVVFFLCAVPSRYVSVGSISAAAALPFLTFFIYYPVSVAFEVPFILVALIVIWAHRSNLRNLRAGSEHRFSVRHADDSDDAKDAVEASREATVADVEQASEQAAAADASHLPAPGEGLFFGDDPKVAEEISRVAGDTGDDEGDDGAKVAR